jgi:hypothetical protein
VQFGFSFIVMAEPPELVQPSGGPLDGPTSFAEAAAMVPAAYGQQRLNA